MKNRTRWTIGLSAFVMLVVLGTGSALEKASSNAHRQAGAVGSQPARASDAAAAPISHEPVSAHPPTTDSSPEYDRSDLLLIQG